MYERNNDNPSNMTEVETSRLEKYVERLREQPQWRNQLLIKNGQATFVKNGKVHTCNKIEGYVKLPDMKCVEPIQQIEMSIGFAPKMRMILWKDKKAYFVVIEKQIQMGVFYLYMQ